MSQYGELAALLCHCRYSSDRDTRSEFDSASCGNLDPLRSQRGVVPYGRQRRDVDQCPRSPRVQRQTKDNAPRRAKQFGLNNNQAAFGIE